MDRYTESFTLVGGGGTDFRPAFARIEQLRAEGPLRDMQGVLYFTDGKEHLSGQTSAPLMWRFSSWKTERFRPMYHPGP